MNSYLFTTMFFNSLPCCGIKTINFAVLFFAFYEPHCFQHKLQRFYPLAGPGVSSVLGYVSIAYYSLVRFPLGPQVF